MKKIKILAAVLFAALMLFSFEGVQAQNNKNNVAEITFSVPSIDCDHCKKRLEANLPFVKGVKDLKISVPEKTVWFKYDPAKVTKAQLAEALTKAGFPGKEITPGSNK